jgi:hypothetical protein
MFYDPVKDTRFPCLCMKVNLLIKRVYNYDQSVIWAAKVERT